MMRRLMVAVLVLVACGAGSRLAAQVDPRTALLERAGWEAVASGRTRAAAEAFEQAIAADPRNARLHLGAGAAAYLERRDADARAALDRALALDPKLIEARLLLGQVQRRMGDLAAAIRTYETAIAAAPDDTAARAALDRWQREFELHDRMQRAIGDRFVVSFEGPSEETLAREALESLDRAYWRIGALLGTYPIDPVPVVLYTTEQFRDITQSPSWAAGAFDGTIRVPMRGALENRTELERVLAHEFAHALIRTLAARNVPTWLNEGLATALEAGDLGWAERRVRDAPAALPLEALRSGFSRLAGPDARLAYATSALAVRRLIEEAGGFAVANLLRDLGEGPGFDAAFLHRIQRPFPDFQASLF